MLSLFECPRKESNTGSHAGHRDRSVPAFTPLRTLRHDPLKVDYPLLLYT
jgi:hypothetical protein